MINFIINDKKISTSLPPGMVLVDFIRYHQHLTGTKIGCREGDCGACTVLVGKLNSEGQSVSYESMTSCLMPLANANGKHIITVEGINFPDHLNPIQQAMADEGATQCGFCTPGFIMSLAGFCLNGKDNGIAAVDGNICRCTGYKSIERAAKRIEELVNSSPGTDRLKFVTETEILPSYLCEIPKRLLLLKDENSGQSVPAALTNDQQLIGGGTDLYVQKHHELVHTRSQYVFDQTELNYIRIKNNTCVIGASVTVTDLKESVVFNKAFPGFQKIAKLISSTPIRNMATIAGNFVNASPIGDMTIFFLALNAQVTLVPGDGQYNNGNSRTIPLRNFYKGYKQLAKEPTEIISTISFELPAVSGHFNFEKVSKRTHLDIASVNSAMYIEIENNIISEVSISAGGVGPIPLFLEKTSSFLPGKSLSDNTIVDAIRIMQSEISPISDARGSKEYKALLLAQLIKAHMASFKQTPK